MRIHQWQVRGPDRSVKELLPETPPSVVGHGILEDNMLYLTTRRAEDGMLFRVFLNPDDLRRLWSKTRPRRLCGRLPADADSSPCRPPDYRHTVFNRWRNDAKFGCSRPALLPYASPVAPAHAEWT